MRTGQVFCNMGFSLGLPDATLEIRLSYSIFRRKMTEARARARHTLSGAHTISSSPAVGVTLDHLAWGGTGQASPPHSCSFLALSIDFPGGPMVKTLRFQCRGMCSIPSQGTKIVAWPKKKEESYYAEATLREWGVVPCLLEDMLSTLVIWSSPLLPHLFILLISLLIILSYYNIFKF